MNRNLGLLILICIALSFCTDKKRKLLVGEWKLVHDSVSCTNPIIDSLEAAKRGAFISPEDAVAADVRNSVKNGEVLVFKDDDHYLQIINGGSSAGKYQLHDSGVILTDNFLGIVTNVYTFNSITEKHLVMTMGIDMRGHSHFYRRRFIKLK